MSEILICMLLGAAVYVVQRNIHVFRMGEWVIEKPHFGPSPGEYSVDSHLDCHWAVSTHKFSDDPRCVKK